MDVDISFTDVTATGDNFDTYFPLLDLPYGTDFDNETQTVTFLSGSLTLTFDIVEQSPPESATFRVHGKGVGASVLVETLVQLAAIDEGTRLTWASEVLERGGLLKPIGTSLIQGAANKITAQVWAEFRRQAGEDAS